MKILALAVLAVIAFQSVEGNKFNAPFERYEIQEPLEWDFNFKNFTDGFIKGLQQDPQTVSICARDIGKVEYIIEDAIDIYNSIIEGKFDIGRTVSFLFEAFHKLKAVEEDCHFLTLIANVAVLFNPYTLAIKAIWWLVVEIWWIVPHTYNLVVAMIYQEDYNIGFYTGKLITDYFEFQIE